MGTRKDEVTEFDRNLGISISIVRTNKKNETQATAAAAVGVNLQTYQHWEAGTRKIKAEHLLALAKHFEVSVDYLLGNAPARSTNPDVQVAMEYTGLSEEVIAFFHERSSSTAFTAENTINNLNAFLTPSNFVWVSLALNSFAREIQASRFDKFIDETIEYVLSEYTEYLEAENINTPLLSIQINREILDSFSTNGNISQNVRVSIQEHLLHTLALPTFLGFLDRNTANIDRYAVSRTLETALDNFTKHIEATAQFPVDRATLESIIKSVYAHKQKYNDLPKNAPTPDGLPF